MRRWQVSLAAAVLILTLGSAALIGCAGGGAAVKAADFYKGNTITFVASSSAGSTTDVLARIIAPLLQKETGATVVVDNKGGAGGIEGINYTYTQAKPDGLTVCLKDTAILWLNQLLEEPGTQWDISKINYLANIQPTHFVFAVTYGGPYTKIDSFRQAKGLKLVGLGPSATIAVSQAGAAELLKLDAKLITGFKGTADLALALSKKEADGMAAEGYTIKRYEDAQQVQALFAMSSQKDLTYPNIPTINELVSVPKDSVAGIMAGVTTGKALFTGPGVPADRVEFLANAFWKIINSEDFKQQFLKQANTTAWVENEKGAQVVQFSKDMLSRKTIGPEMKALLAKYRP